MCHLNFSFEDVDFIEEIGLGKDSKFRSEIGEDEIRRPNFKPNRLFGNIEQGGAALKVEEIFTLQGEVGWSTDERTDPGVKFQFDGATFYDHSRSWFKNLSVRGVLSVTTVANLKVGAGTC